jgi:hypothetical protein
MYVEGIGHSGLRVYSLNPISGPILRPFGMDVAIEDQ